MKLKKLDIHNFGTIRHIELPLDDLGFVLVLGDNRDAAKADSNGAGKTMLLEAFVWCCWGETVRKLEYDDDVINEQVGKDCKVSLYLEDGGNDIVIHRFRGHSITALNSKKNDLVVQINGKAASVTDAVEMQTKINSILGTNFNTFCALLPGTSIKAATLGDVAIKDLLDKILQTELYADAKELSDEQLEEVEKKIDGLHNIVTGLKTHVASVEANLAAYEESNATFEMDKAYKLEALEAEAKDLRSTLAGYSSTLARIAEVKEAITKSQEKLNKIRTDTKATEVSIAKINNAIILYKAQGVAESKSIDKAIQALRAKMASNTELIGICHTCDQTVSESHVLRLNDGLEKQIKDQEALKAVVVASFADKIKLEELSLTELTLVLEVASTAAADLCLKRSLLDTDLNELRTQLSSEPYVRKQLDTNQKLIQGLQEHANPFTNFVNSAKKEIKEHQDTIESHTKVIEELEKDKEFLEFWSKAFSPQGIRNFLLNSIVNTLNERAKYYCKLLTNDEMSIVFDTKKELKTKGAKDKFSINVQQLHGGTGYKKASSGEKKRADIVISMVLSDLAAMKSTKHIPFRFLDEPFENIDELGTEAIVALLNEYKKKYNTVFVVTHLDNIKNIFSKCITVVKEKGISTLEWTNHQ